MAGQRALRGFLAGSYEFGCVPEAPWREGVECRTDEPVGRGPRVPHSEARRKRPSVHGDADHVVRTKIACGLDGDRVDDGAIDELSAIDLDRRKDSRYRRARVRSAHRIASAST